MTANADLSTEERRYPVMHGPLDLVATTFPLRQGTADPTLRVAGGEVWRALRTPHGAATLRLRVEGSELVARATGPGARAALNALADLPAFQARVRLQSLPGVGRWTAAEVTGVTHGDPDAVPLGDYHLPNVLVHALAGEPRGDDPRMLELLEPYAGQRGRVIRLLMSGGRVARGTGRGSAGEIFDGADGGLEHSSAAI
jgi:hypothetical protein